MPPPPPAPHPTAEAAGRPSSGRRRAAPLGNCPWCQRDKGGSPLGRRCAEPMRDGEEKWTVAEGDGERGRSEVRGGAGGGGDVGSEGGEKWRAHKSTRLRRPEQQLPRPGFLCAPRAPARPTAPRERGVQPGTTSGPSPSRRSTWGTRPSVRLLHEPAKALWICRQARDTSRDPLPQRLDPGLMHVSHLGEGSRQPARRKRSRARPSRTKRPLAVAP